MAFNIKVDSTSADLTNQYSHDFTVKFIPSIKLDGRWEMAFIKAHLWYSYYNISSELNNNTLRYNNGVSYSATITIPDGQYTVGQLNTYIQSVMSDNGDFTLDTSGNEVYDIVLEANQSTIRVNLTLTNSYTLDLTLSDLYLLLGFAQEEISVSGDAPNVANINNSINTLDIHNSLITTNFNNSSKSDIIETFTPETVPGSNIVLNPPYKIFFPIQPHMNVISEMRTYITDNSNNIINFNGEPTTYVFHFRPVMN